MGTWFGNRTTLHTVWDRSLINMVVANNYSGNATLWSQALVERAQQYEHEWLKWTSCAHSLIDDPWHACTDVWIGESNRLCMSNVYRYNATGPSFNYTTGFVIDDSSHYYEFNIPVVEYQIVRAGVRLANVLNRIFEAVTHTTPLGRLVKLVRGSMSA